MAPKKGDDVAFPNNWRDPAKLTAVFDKLVEANSGMFDMRRSEGRAAAAIRLAQKEVLAELSEAVSDFACYIKSQQKR